jgi:hypothetical protein
MYVDVSKLYLSPCAAEVSNQWRRVHGGPKFSAAKLRQEPMKVFIMELCRFDTSSVLKQHASITTPGRGNVQDMGLDMAVNNAIDKTRQIFISERTLRSGSCGTACSLWHTLYCTRDDSDLGVAEQPAACGTPCTVRGTVLKSGIVSEVSKEMTLIRHVGCRAEMRLSSGK